MMFNAQSIRNKMGLFRALIQTEKCDVIGITESWIDTSTRDFEGEYNLQGYKMFKRDRIGKQGGGVLLYIREYLDPVDCRIETEHEVLGVTLNKLEKKLYLYLVYRPPHQCLEKDIDLYRNLSNIIKNKLCIVTGDFNCPINWSDRTSDAQGKRLLDFTNEEYLTQWVDEPTRGNNILDLVFTSEDNLISKLKVGEKLGKSDHSIVRFNIDISFTKIEKTFARLNFRKADLSRLREQIKKIPIGADIDVDQKWLSFRTNFMTDQDLCIPKKGTTRNGTSQPKWFNSDIAKAIGDRQKAYKLLKTQPSQELETAHKRKCREVDRLVRKAKLDNEDRIAARAKENPKEFFQHVNSRKPIKSTIGPLKDKDGKIISSDEGMGELLNEYFANVYTIEDTSELPTTLIKYEGNEPLENIEITEEIIKLKIRKLNKNKSPGPDEFHPRVIKEVEEEIAPHLGDIYRTSLEQGKAVRDWKLQNIAPIFKKGSKEDPGNHRPVSLTSVPGKMLESIIADNIISHLETNNLILDSQHGFRSGRSCLTNLLDFFHEMFSIYDKSRAIDILYLDFRKAFDKVPHKRLILKVRSLGIGGKVADWIEDWLRNRKQRVVINGRASGWRNVTSGVPQGSVLGPLLFIMYINDLDIGLVSKISKFADDTKLGVNANCSEAVEHLKEDLRKLGEWSLKWQMPFNVDKCKVMHIGHKNKNVSYSLLGTEIESSQQEKDLGVIITSDLHPSKQCIEVEKKAQKLIGYIKRQFNTRKKETILTLYNALVRPHLEYAVQFWAPSQRKDIDRLEKVQARITKLIPAIRHMGYNRRLEKLNLYTLETRRLRGQLIETFKILKGINKIDYRNLFTMSSNLTRSNGWKLELQRFSTSHCGNFFTYKIASTWNRLPSEVVDSSTITQFKKGLDKVINTLL